MRRAAARAAQRAPLLRDTLLRRIAQHRVFASSARFSAACLLAHVRAQRVVAAERYVLRIAVIGRAENQSSTVAGGVSRGDGATLRRVTHRQL